MLDSTYSESMDVLTYEGKVKCFLICFILLKFFMLVAV